jgi:aminoglycoside phosphotransferase (APT) family kinase protein
VDEELPLGGNFSASVKIGDTVHRRAGPWTRAVHALLAHLQRVGFPAPEVVGMDEQGRAVLSFIPGEVHAGWPEPLPSWMFEDEATLMAAGRLLRRYHDAVTSFVPPANAHWRFVAPGAHEVICHNDWSPSNALFRGHIPIVMLDWDSAGPGSRAWDVASAAYWWVPLNPRATPPDLAAKASRFALVCDAYGGAITREQALKTLIELLPAQADVIQAGADAGDPGFAKLAGWNIPAALRDDAARLVEQRGVLCGEP